MRMVGMTTVMNHLVEDDLLGVPLDLDLDLASVEIVVVVHDHDHGHQREEVLLGK